MQKKKKKTIRSKAWQELEKKSAFNLRKEGFFL